MSLLPPPPDPPSTPKASAPPGNAGPPAAWACPVPASDPRRIQLAHGGGGSLTRDLVERLMLPAFANAALDQRHDAAVLGLVPDPDAPTGNTPRLAFTTDSHVVRPLFFPGGDLGSLAVNGTLNDLAMAGAEPLALSAAFILEEGLPMETLERLVESMRQSAAAAGVPIVTGDTKVVERGRGDGVFITTTGLGRIRHHQTIAPASIRPGDRILFSGDLGRHGMAILATREGLEFETSLVSDCASLVAPALALVSAGIQVRCLRDLTRGGAAAALHEIATAAGVTLQIEEDAVAVPTAVRAACEILGLDPLQVPCEGRFLAVIPPAEVDAALHILRQHPVAGSAAVVGEVRSAGRFPVLRRGPFGSERPLEMGTGEQLPRIC